ncbi:putative DNA modification/repair radical SAM protein [Henriciella litoralis]|uniref:putative DNA modification/repair radical SAM protein n=1 Tax=Henriciella litoralis TaxID=568102 RepID=UPI0009FDA367|nr:putative DNA modification/repair radical SAM protein [Henriciella litoralis]
MAKKSLIDRLAILADAAKYDASCASSGSVKRNSMKTGGVGSTGGTGICHAYAPDGRCISLLKILMTNFCIYDCRYCVNRVSSNVERARFSVDEIVQLTLDFYKRNYIEGLFLSSGIIRSSNYTMEQMVEVARKLREDHHFGGYIHLKSIPEADPALIEQAGLHADRLSINIELPKETSLKAYAPEKSGAVIRTAMASVRKGIDDRRTDIKERAKARPKKFAPGGQSTQMIVGADASSDRDIISTSATLYTGYKLRRVYYSAFSPIQDSSADLPIIRPPLMREHRLYQADWLMRFYGFEQEEIFEARRDGMLDLEIDPKLAWALERRERFPVDVNRASREDLLRVPGFGTKTVNRILTARRHTHLRLEHVGKIVRSLKASRDFIQTIDWHPARTLDITDLRSRFLPKPVQLELL